jgi:hypothetical protein
MSKLKTEPTPLFGCHDCSEEYSWPADDLAVYEGELWCHNCFDFADVPEGTNFHDMPKFVPAHEMEIEQLKTELKRAKAGWNDTMDSLCDVVGGNMALQKGVEQLKAEHDAALERIDSLNQSLAKAWTRLSDALARVEELRGIIEYECMSYAHFGEQPPQRFLDALELPTTETEEEPPEITAPFGMAKIANVMGEDLLDKEDCVIEKCNKCGRVCI